MKLPKGKKLLRIASAAVLATSSLGSLIFASSAYAGSLSNIQVRFNDMKTSDFTDGTVCAKPTTAGTEGNVQVTFPTGFTVSTTAANWTVNTTNTAWPSSAVAWLGITAPSGAPSGQNVVFASGDLTVGTLYCFNWTNTSAALQEPSGAGSNELGTVTTQTAGSATIDSGQFATATLTNNTVTVTATVPPLFSFALGSNSDPLGTITNNTLTSTTAGNRYTLTVNTNAKNGFQVWAKDTNAGLHSTQASYTIGSSTGTLSVPGEAYNTGVFSKSQVGGTGTVSIGAGFDDTGANFTGGGLTTSLQTVATSTGTADTSVLTIANNIVIRSTTPAATDYTDTQTYVAAGLF